MRFATTASFLSLAVGIASAAIKAEDLPNAIQFAMWNGDCGAKGTHTLGMMLTSRSHTDLCFPLADDTKALDVQMIEPGCRLTAYKDSLCDDYPEEGSYTEQTGCLWTDRTYKSYKLTCS
ncbi:hypothetical protein F5Y13DRAFT_193758 [Hypoxylon sp. FL1857]|nr:hypothetical protein F5Y13DRAFT_193758 [Hypoxylon sp. FL1857]